MIEKNPYENDEYSNLEEKELDGIDMSAFKLADNNTNEADFEYDDEEEEEPRRKLNYRGVVVVGAVLIVLLLIAAISGWIFGISKNNALTKLKTEYTTLETKVTEANNNLTALQNDYTLLSAELEKLKSQQNTNNNGTSESGSSTPTEANTKYTMNGDVAVRKGAGTSNDFVSFEKLPAEIQDVVYSNGDEVRTRDGAVVPIYETKGDSDSNTWGRIADGAWVCLTYQGEAWGTKK